MDHRCPDGGYCHHLCPADRGCLRVSYGSAPLAGVYPGDAWPPEVRAAVEEGCGVCGRRTADVSPARSHDASPAPGTLRDFAGIPRDEVLAFDHPLAADCLVCREPIRQEAFHAPWQHTLRCDLCRLLEGGVPEDPKPADLSRWAR